jgi:beta-phosphoglucomutase
MTSIKAVVFDMDGVLVDAKEWHYEAFNRALRLFGHAVSRYDHLVTFDGLPTRKKLEMLTRERGLPPRLHSLINQLKQTYTMQLIHANCSPTFAHEYALSRLKSRGFRLGVASNSIRSTVEAMMNYTRLATYLDFMISNEDVTHSKPDPEMYVRAAAQAGAATDEILVVEDNEIGIAAAKAAGSHVMIVKHVDEVNLDNIERHLARCGDGARR